jgi:hypothetical protein
VYFITIKFLRCQSSPIHFEYEEYLLCSNGTDDLVYLTGPQNKVFVLDSYEVTSNKHHIVELLGVLWSDAILNELVHVRFISPISHE